MQVKLMLWLSALGLLLLTLPTHADGIVPGHVLVRLQPGASIAAVAADYGATVEEQVPDTPIYSLRLPSGRTESEFAAQLAADARLVWAETDTYVASPEHGQTFHFAFDAGGTAGAYINQGAYAQVHWGRATTVTTGAGTIVALLDTGVTFDHPALVGHLLPGYNAREPGKTPRDVPDGVTNAAVGHGTMTAGLIARLAPGAKILPIRVLNGDGDGTMLDVAKGIYYALAHGARVLNMSFGSRDKTGILNDALDAAETEGAVLVASAGNAGADLVQFPAAGKGALAVGAVEADNVKSPYSNFGSWLRVVAPGTGIRSAYYTGGYANWSGTSFAAPFVSAEAALILAARPDWTGDAVADLIRSTARSVDSVNPAYKGKLGKGLIDIEAAVFAAAPPAPVSLTLAPASVWGGAAASGTVTLSSPAPAGGLRAYLFSNTASALVPAFVLVPAGAQTAAFSITTRPVAVTQISTLKAVRGSVTVYAALRVAAPALASLAIAPHSVRGGAANAVGTVTLSSPAPAGGAVVDLRSDTGYGVVPAQVRVAAGDRTAAFSVQTRPVSAVKAVTVTASFNGVARAVGLLLTP